MTLHAVTVLGHDRPGIIAQTTGVLADLGLNIDDSTMTLLRGHFAMMLVVDGAASSSEIEEALSVLTDGGSLDVTVREVPEETGEAAGVPHVLNVHGADRPGIVSAITNEVAAVGGNITDLSTRLVGGFYVLSCELDLSVTVDAIALGERLDEVAQGLGVRASLQPMESDDL
jgi:glycine cleavage system transcriptional repressor